MKIYLVIESIPYQGYYIDEQTKAFSSELEALAYKASIDIGHGRCECHTIEFHTDEQ
jgi:hypothetical protein